MSVAIGNNKMKREEEDLDRYITGIMIKQLREKNRMTQLQLAEKLGVSDKTISKWETGKGYPDITLLEPIAAAFSVSVPELMAGSSVQNANVSANMLRSVFYICPVCGNIIHSTGAALISCHGIVLSPAEAEKSDETHMIFIEKAEDEYYVRVDHPMEKRHYISFVAALSVDDIQLQKLYPEGNAEVRFKMRGVKKIVFYCNRDGLFYTNVSKGIDDRELSYDNYKERMELEHAAAVLFDREAAREAKKQQ